MSRNKTRKTIKVPVSWPSPNNETFTAGESKDETRNTAVTQTALKRMKLFGILSAPSRRRAISHKRKEAETSTAKRPSLAKSMEATLAGRKKMGSKNVATTSKPEEIASKEKSELFCLFMISSGKN